MKENENQKFQKYKKYYSCNITYISRFLEDYITVRVWEVILHGISAIIRVWEAILHVISVIASVW